MGEKTEEPATSNLYAPKLDGRGQPLGPASFEALPSLLKLAFSGAYKSFASDGVVHPIALAEIRRDPSTKQPLAADKYGLVLIPPPADAGYRSDADGPDKDAHAAAIRAAIKELQASEVAFVSEVWAVFDAGASEADKARVYAIRPSAHPARREAVWVVYETKRGHNACYAAMISDIEGKRALEPFQCMTTTHDGGSGEGRFAGFFTPEAQA